MEAAVETLISAVSAERAGVDRLELCSALSEGGLTPSAGLIASVLERVRIPVFIMVRGRGGHFVCSDDELQVMRRDVEHARAAGAAGIVTGVLRPDFTIDTGRMRQLVDAAGDLPVTFHRAFDLTTDPDAALDRLIGAGVRRVLTSGRAASALDGADTIARLVGRAAGRITVVAGGGVRADNVLEIVTRTRVAEVHTGVSRVTGEGHWPSDPGIRIRKAPLADDGAWSEADEDGMRRLVERLQTR